MSDRLCHNTDCHHPESAHTKLVGCTHPADETQTSVCRCEHFKPAAEEETGTGRTIPARNTDPETSHKATKAIHIRAGNQRTLLLRAFDALEDATDEEAMEHAEGVSASSEYAKRCSELRQAGYIEATGDERTGGSGQSRIVCRITTKGEQAIAALGGGITVKTNRRRVSRLSKDDEALVQKLAHLVEYPNASNANDTPAVKLQLNTAQELLELVGRLS